MFRKPHTALLFARLGIYLLLGVCPVFGAGLKQLHGHVPEIAKKLSPISRLAATNELHLAIGVPLRDPAGLDKFLADVYDPASPNYRHFLTPAEFTARFSATEADYAAVKKFALTNGFTIATEHPNRLVLDVVAKVGDVERAFHLKMNKFKHPTEAREFFAPDAEPTVDAGLAVTGVSGLENFYTKRPRSSIKSLSQVNLAAPRSGSGSGGAYMGNDFRTAYVPGVTLTGAGQSVALLQFDGYYSNDIAAYISTAGLTNFHGTLSNVAVNGGVSTPGSGNGEVCLDIEMVMSMAPGVSQIIVYEGPNGTTAWSTILSKIANDNLAKQISCSWGNNSPGAIDTTSENIFKQMAAQGQSFFNASGDSDAFVGGIPFPSESTNITQVGATTLTMNGTAASYASETVWNWGNGTGSSGGVSANFPLPSWQQGIGMIANQGSTTMRNVPDVALTGDNVFVTFSNGITGVFGGTSCAAPLWAGFMALVNQQAAANGNSSAGFINPAIYGIGKGANPNYSYAACFHDTTTGNNYSPSSPSNFPAVAGYDLCTGWGTPNGQNLINALAGPADALGITPGAGFAATGLPGGPFSPSSQVFTLTNTSASSFNWSLINTSAWLTVSSGSGTLTAAGQTTTSVSINSVANGLAVGSYAATVVFSNQSSHFVQNAQFTLKISDSLTLLTTSGLSAYGSPGGPFNPGAQTVVFTNLSASAVAWSLINTSAWLSVSSSSGSTGGNTSTTVTVSTNVATATLGAGIYNAMLVLSNQSTHLTQNILCSLNIAIVQNGGFETADLTGWTFTGTLGSSGNGSANYIATTGDTYISPHGGSYALALGDTKIDTLTQTLSTIPGQVYLFSFWLKNSNAGTTEIFQAAWNNTNVYSITNPPSMSWTNLRYTVIATGTNTTLQFAAENDPAYFGLDDISVTPVSLPSITQQPVSQTNLIGSIVSFSAVANGMAPLAYQWRTNGVNLVNNAVVSGATSNVLTLTGISLTNAGNYTLVVSNTYGAVTSSIASLTIVLPPSFTGNVTNRTIECGANTNNFSITIAGTPPLGIQWKLDGSPVAGATNASFGLTNLFSPSHTVTVTVTNLYVAVSSNATLTVQDTRPPVITILGANPLTNELGFTFIDPGATASDTCAGTLPVVTNGVVNTGAVGTNILKYIATDGVNSVTNTRTVIVRDTTPPTISWSFTNLILAANSSCVAVMPNITGTNYIVATDLSGALTITQNPTNNFSLSLGTNVAVITVADASGNKAYATNQIIVQDQTPPVIVIPPQSQTNSVGGNASFSVGATACTPLALQWYFNGNALAGQTNNTLNLTNLTGLSAGKYYAVATATGGSTPSPVVTLTVTLGSAPKIASSSAPAANAGFSLNCQGVAGFTYILETTTNISLSAAWQAVATNIPATNGVVTFTDPQATNFLQRFYRIKLGP